MLKGNLAGYLQPISRYHLPVGISASLLPQAKHLKEQKRKDLAGNLLSVCVSSFLSASPGKLQVPCRLKLSSAVEVG